MSSQYGPTANATLIRSSCYRMGRLVVISGIGQTAAALDTGGGMPVWSCPQAFGEATECFLNFYDKAKSRGYVASNRVWIWNDAGAQIPSGSVFVFQATYFTAS